MIDNPKLKALVQLLKGRPLDCLHDEVTPPYIRGLLDGRRNLPWPADKPKAYLIFAVHPETTAMLSAELERLEVSFCVLRGTRAQKDEAVRQIREGEVNTILVTAPRDCAGLDMPYLSHVVFYHRMLDQNVEAQVAARGQRLGRTHNLEIVTLVNEAEAHGL
jgi:superfamily II DNA/RNA helicase